MPLRFFAALFAVLLSTPAAAQGNVSSISQSGGQTCISSNGTPSHAIGPFRGPNRFQALSLRYCFDSTPELRGRVTLDVSVVGVTLEGIPIRPGTAEWWDPNGRRGYSRDRSSGWNLQALYHDSIIQLDAAGGHVDGRGLYHYHDVSRSVLGDAGLLGMAADGFEIRYATRHVASSWQLKTGTRSSGPGGAYDGEFEQDYEYVAGSGTLDECNGAMVDGVYTYFATETYPFVPRCFRGTVGLSFLRP